VLEIVLGIVIGPSGLGWAKPDAPVSVLALIGLAFLLFLSGLEIDVERLRGRIVKLTALGFVVSFAIAILIGIGLRSGGFVKSPLFIAVVLVATALGVIFPVLKDSGNINSSLGELVIAAASIADFGSIILLSLFFSGKSSTSAAPTPPPPPHCPLPSCLSSPPKTARSPAPPTPSRRHEAPGMRVVSRCFGRRWDPQPELGGAPPAHPSAQGDPARAPLHAW
jgi:hypothetical protein